LLSRICEEIKVHNIDVGEQVDVPDPRVLGVDLVILIKEVTEEQHLKQMVGK